jgi:hypothetical protein
MDDDRSRPALRPSITPTTQREYAYDRDSHIGKLDRALDQAAELGWTVVSMKDDWTTIFPPAKK